MKVTSTLFVFVIYVLCNISKAVHSAYSSSFYQIYTLVIHSHALFNLTHNFGSIGGFPPFRNLRFWQESARGIFSTCRNVLVLKIPPAEKSQWQKVETFPCWNFHVPELSQRQTVHVKCSCAENSSCRKVPVSKNRNVPMLKRPCARTFPAPNGACAEMFPWWNIRAEISLAEISGAEMVESPIGNNLMYQCIASSISISIAFYVCIGCHFVNTWIFLQLTCAV